MFFAKNRPVQAVFSRACLEGGSEAMISTLEFVSESEFTTLELRNS